MAKEPSPEGAARAVDPDGALAAERLIKSLQGSDWTPQSSRNPSYNCFAWAARDSNMWFEPPGTAPWTCWPDDLPAWDTLENYVRLYEKLDFEVCADDCLEEGIEKIAIFVDEVGAPSHAARQLPTGRWTSKWGKGIDFEHDLSTVDGDPAVGSIRTFMRRRMPGPPPAPGPGMFLAGSLEDEPRCIFDD